MAKVMYGALIVEARGSAGSETYSKNAAGLYVKARTAPPYSNTSFQANTRNNMRTVSQAWRTLTDLQRQSWNIFADILTHRKYRFVEIFADGYRVFLRCNMNRLNAGLSLLSVPGPIPKFPVTSIDYVQSNYSTDLLIIHVTNAIDPLNFSFNTYFSKPVSPGIGFGQKLLRYTYTRSTSSTAVAIDYHYDDRFGLRWVPGDYIFAGFSILHIKSGLCSKIQYIRTLTY